MTHSAARSSRTSSDQPPFPSRSWGNAGRSGRHWALALAGVLGASSVTLEASACGGFFCSAAQPVNQAAERIVFAKNSDGTVTQIVQILYEGPSERFSWVLPVVGTPEIDISSDQAFAALQQATNPQYQLRRTFEESCFGGGAGGSATGGLLLDGGGAPSDGPEVRVLAAGTVGPFDYEVLSVRAGSADAADVAAEWLEDNGYDLAPQTRDVLGPYLAAGMNLVAFRLTKGATTGSIRPVTLTYESKRPAIPIRPTAVAANDDMGVLVWVLGESRAVPKNYFSLELNEALIDWFNPGASYDRVVTAAADEAGGQGFVTEFAGPASPLASTILPLGLRQTRSNLGLENDAGRLVLDAAQVFGPFDGFTDVLRRHVTLREGWTPEDFVSCPACYEEGWSSLEDAPWLSGQQPAPIGQDDPVYDTSKAAFLTDFDELVFEPLSRTADLFRAHPTVTRLYTTMSANEMTKDPEFDFNPDLEDVSNVHQADQLQRCDGTWTITLPNGIEVDGEGFTWPYALGAPDSVGLPVNARILQLGTSGPGDVVLDNTQLIQSQLQGASSGTSGGRNSGDGGGCACATTLGGAGGLGSLWALPALVGAIGLRRRRR